MSLSDRQAVAGLKEGDAIVLTTGRRYLSNEAYEQALNGTAPDADIRVASATAARIYRVDATKVQTVREIANH